jgi:hypothetical protein
VYFLLIEGDNKEKHRGGGIIGPFFAYAVYIRG